MKKCARHGLPGTRAASKKDAFSITLGTSEKCLHRHFSSYTFDHFGVLKVEPLASAALSSLRHSERILIS